MLTFDSSQSGPAASCLRLEPRTSAPAIEDCYRNLAAAVLLQAKKDLAEPGHRTSALRWLHSSGARAYAEMLGIEPAAVVNLAQRGRR
jgi:hypothetical protein